MTPLSKFSRRFGLIFNSILQDGEGKMSESLRPLPQPSKMMTGVRNLWKLPTRNETKTTQVPSRTRIITRQKPRMYANGTQTCPVRSLKLYTEKRNKAHRQLDDTTFYKHLSEHSLSQDQKVIADTVKTHIKNQNLPLIIKLAMGFVSSLGVLFQGSAMHFYYY